MELERLDEATWCIMILDGFLEIGEGALEFAKD